MNSKRFFAAVVSIVLFALVWNGIIHMVILREADAVMNTIGRSPADRNLWLSLLGTLVLAVLFMLGYVRTCRTGSVREGVLYGFAFGILAGVLVDLNQYVLYPIPPSLAAAWFAFGLAEFCVYGVIASRVYLLKR